MAQVLRLLQPPEHPDLLVGPLTGDDAAVWRLDEGRALVATVDVVTPIVDDARTWGRIAATNAASDVYAMGGRPLFALNIVGWNRDELPLELLVEVLRGAADAAAEGGWVAVGGHSIDDPEPKFGQAVLGEVDPARMLTNAGLRDGDALVLTKPLGIGAVTTALKAGRVGEPLLAAAIAEMTRPNRAASEAALAAGATGATDVTGYGLLGHLRAMAEASGVDVAVDADAVPLLDGVRDLVRAGLLPGGTRRNLDWVRPRLVVDGAGEEDLLLLADAQTSGGLLFGAAPERARQAVADLVASGHGAAVVGAARAGSGLLTVRGAARR